MHVCAKEKGSKEWHSPSLNAVWNQTWAWCVHVAEAYSYVQHCKKSNLALIEITKYFSRNCNTENSTERASSVNLIKQILDETKVILIEHIEPALQV